MNQKVHVAALLNKQMDRKDFLKYMGAAGFVITGLSGITKALLQHDELQPKSTIQTTARHSYNSGSYGG